MNLRHLVKDATDSGLYKQVGEYMIAIRGTFGTDWTIVTYHHKGVMS